MRGHEKKGNESEISISSSPKPVAKAPRKKPQIELPDDWRPSIEGFKLTTAKGLDFEETFLRFRAYHQSKGSLMASWNAAWVTWCHSPYNKPQAGKATSMAENDRRLAELSAELTGFPSPNPPEAFNGPTIDGDFSHV